MSNIFENKRLTVNSINTVIWPSVSEKILFSPKLPNTLEGKTSKSLFTETNYIESIFKT